MAHSSIKEKKSNDVTLHTSFDKHTETRDIDFNTSSTANIVSVYILVYIPWWGSEIFLK